MDELNKNLKFSIVIPTYNRANLIKATIESVLQQDYTNFELIIVDDGSTDNTEETVKSIKDNRILYYKKINEERSVARNFGFNKANGDYVIFFDSDDLMLPNHVSTLNKEILNLNCNVNFIASKFILFRNNTTISSSNTNLKQGWYSIDCILKGNIFACHICVKRENPNLQLFLEDQYIAEDWVFLMNNLKDDNIFLIDKITITFNDHDLRSMRSVNNKHIIQQNLKAFEWVQQNISLTTKQNRIVKSYIYYFCAIHAYIDCNRKDALRFLRKALSAKKNGIKETILFIKILIGYRTLHKFSS